ASIPHATTRTVRVVVSDNGSTDGSVEAAAIAHPNIEVLYNESNLGYGRAINAAVQTLDESVGWLLVVNPDSVFSPGSIDVMLEGARQDFRIGAIGPLIVSE